MKPWTTVLFLSTALIWHSSDGSTTTDESVAAAAMTDHGAALVRWLRSNGGYFNPKVEFRRLDVSDPTSPTGLFAIKDVSEKETLMVIPQACLITSGGTYDMCDTARNLLREMKLGPQSKFAPYITYLMDSKPGHIPSSWSRAGQNLLRSIIGTELPPRGVTGLSLEALCGDAYVTGDPLEHEAHYYVVTRSWTDVVVPLLDTINHRNGNWTSIDNTDAHSGEDITVFATRPVRAGDQFYSSYNECSGSDCEGIAHTYGMQHILKDYGFVEQYPQRFVFHAGPDLVFDLNEVRPSSSSDDDANDFRKRELEITWLSDRPESHQINYLRGHLKRLRGLAHAVYNQAQRLASTHERETIVEFYDALTVALDHAIRDDGKGSTDECYGRSSSDDETDGVCSDPVADDEAAKKKPHDHEGGGNDVYADDDDDDDDEEDDDDNSGDNLSRKEKHELCVEQCDDEEDDDDDDDDDEDKQECVRKCDKKYKNVNHNEYLCNIETTGRAYVAANYETTEEIDSFYTKIEFQHSSDLRDTCLLLNDWLQACQSFRPHYHEVIVHYSARYVDELRRVFFIGGGDSMLLHEILKYPTLELVIGLELDQQVVRSSFKNLGTRPHWDDPRVQWWFGDGAKSLLALPREYYGTFDLVIVDLETEVKKVLRVSDDLDIVDAAVLLLKPEGILAWNEDDYLNFYEEDERDFIEHTVDLSYHDVPIICHQSLAIGSHTVDFMNKSPKDHGVETLFLPSLEEMRDNFEGWYNYRKGSRGGGIGGSVGGGNNKRCRRSDEGEGKELSEKMSARSLGVLMVLEVEQIDMPLDSLSSLRDRVGGALEKMGLTEISVRTSPWKGPDEGGVRVGGKKKTKQKKSKKETIIFVLREGYVVVRPWPEHRYCAFDVMLWTDLAKQEDVKAVLISAVGGGGGGDAVGRSASSSFRIVTGGMFGVGTDEERQKIGPPAPEPCDGVADTIPTKPAQRSVVDAVVAESIVSLIQGANLTIAVLCGETSHRCGTLETLMNSDDGVTVVSLWSCPGVEGKDDDTAHVDDVERKKLPACMGDTLRTLQGFVEANGKIKGIVIDPDAQPHSGHVLYDVLSSSSRVKRELLVNDIVVVEATAISTVSSSEEREEEQSSWRRDLLESFRTDFFKFDPAYRAELVLDSTLKLGIFSSGDSSFYSHLVDTKNKIESNLGLAAVVRNVKNGLQNYVADFEPTQFFTHDDFGHDFVMDEWLSQRPLGQQVVSQFELTTVITDDGKDGHHLSPPPQSKAQVKEALLRTLRLMNDNVDGDDVGGRVDVQADDVGDGFVLVAFWPEVDAVLSWDGRGYIDANIFTRDEGMRLPVAFQERLLVEIPTLTTIAADRHPRGFGRVVNFRRDIAPHWVVK